MKGIEKVITDLQEIEQQLGEAVSDEQYKQEELGNYSSGFGKICVPEDAAPGLDNARTHLQDAIIELLGWQKENEPAWKEGVPGLDGMPHQE